jgi:hypothetical protein
MSTATKNDKQSHRSHRPKAATVFAAAFIAGAAAAFGLNRALDVHLAQSKPQVESEAIFVALRSLPQGSPVTVWDVALRDWPKAMMPMAAVRPHDSFEGQILKHSLREGQPLLKVQLVKAPSTTEGQIVGSAAAGVLPVHPAAAIPQPDLWAPGEQAAATVAKPAAVSQAAPATLPVAAVAEATPPAATAAEAQLVADVPAAAQPAQEPTVAVEQTAEAAPVAEPEIVSVVRPAAEPAAATSGDIPVETVQTDPETMRQGSTAAASVPVVRYLVVPERIALQADRSFTPATQAPAQPAARQQPEPQRQPELQRQPEPRPAVVQQTPPVRQAPQQQANSPRQRQARTPATQRGDAANQQPQRPAPGKPRPTPNVARENASTFKTMFPNLSAGMTAVEDQFEKIKRERQAELDSAAAADDSAQQPPAKEPSQRSAFRPFSRG